MFSCAALPHVSVPSGDSDTETDGISIIWPAFLVLSVGVVKNWLVVPQASGLGLFNSRPATG